MTGEYLIPVAERRDGTPEKQMESTPGGVVVTRPFHVKTKIASNAFEVHVFLVHFLPTRDTNPGFDPGFSYDSTYQKHLPYKKVIRYL